VQGKEDLNFFYSQNENDFHYYKLGGYIMPAGVEEDLTEQGQ
jgi:hypothetical protein